MNQDLLGFKASDKVTGFSGTIVGGVQYLTGCAQYLLQPDCNDKRDTLPEARWFDEGRIKIEGTEPVIKKEDLAAPEDGCDYAPPKSKH